MTLMSCYQFLLYLYSFHLISSLYHPILTMIVNMIITDLQIQIPLQIHACSTQSTLLILQDSTTFSKTSRGRDPLDIQSTRLILVVPSLSHVPSHRPTALQRSLLWHSIVSKSKESASIPFSLLLMLRGPHQRYHLQWILHRVGWQSSWHCWYSPSFQFYR